MAGGVSYLNAQVAFQSATRNVYDVTRWGASLSADVLTNYGDDRKYPQQAASVRHRATLSFDTMDLSLVAQASSAANLIGTASSNGAKLTVAKNGSGTMIYTISPSVVIRADASGGYGDLAMVSVECETMGASGTEPTVSWAVGA